jgi:hypothetical protein
MAEESRAIGAHVHLAEPAEISARRGTKKRAKTVIAETLARRPRGAVIPPARA